MSDCGCDKAKKDLEEFLRNEVCSTEAADIREHLDNCTSCQDEALVARTLTEAIQRACRETAPDALKAQVLASIRQVQSTHAV